MPKNNGKARKAWRKENADYNKAWWDAHADNRLTPEERLVFNVYAKPYVRHDRPVRP